MIPIIILSLLTSLSMLSLSVNTIGTSALFGLSDYSISSNAMKCLAILMTIYGFTLPRCHHVCMTRGADNSTSPFRCSCAGGYINLRESNVIIAFSNVFFLKWHVCNINTDFKYDDVIAQPVLLMLDGDSGTYTAKTCRFIFKWCTEYIHMWISVYIMFLMWWYFCHNSTYFIICSHNLVMSGHVNWYVVISINVDHVNEK